MLVGLAAAAAVRYFTGYFSKVGSWSAPPALLLPMMHGRQGSINLRVGQPEHSKILTFAGADPAP